MKLFITPTSPYARMARIAVLEKGLEDSVEIIEATTRRADSPYYATNPSGRVPFLMTDDGMGLEDSALICRFLDRQIGSEQWGGSGGAEPWEALRLEALARSMLDGIAVLARELRRPENERSPGIIDHEIARSQRFADLWEREIEKPVMQGGLNHAQVALIVTLEMEGRVAGFSWRAGHPKLAAWADRLGARPAVAATRAAPG